VNTSSFAFAAVIANAKFIVEISSQPLCKVKVDVHSQEKSEPEISL
jgi:hypothetical protein